MNDVYTQRDAFNFGHIQPAVELPHQHARVSQSLRTCDQSKVRGSRQMPGGGNDGATGGSSASETPTGIAVRAHSLTTP